MDIDMPVMNGIEATKAIIRRFRFINIIAVSFHNEMQSVRQMVESGARNYLVKEDISPETIEKAFSSLTI
jgi:DNA-binding NarL/FixJ family response regulator